MPHTNRPDAATRPGVTARPDEGTDHTDPTDRNVVVLRGHVSSEPRPRALPSGSSLVQVEVTTRTSTGTATVPVVWFDPTTEIVDGAEVLVVGQVRRRFFRAAGVTQSRTEVVADRIVPASRRRQVERELARVLVALGA